MLHAHRTPDELELHLPATPEQVGLVRARVDPLAAAAGLDDGVRRDVALVLSEACTNVVLHAYAHTDVAEEDRVLLVVARHRPGCLEVEVSDRGSGMAVRADSPGLGLGLPLIASLTDSVEVRRAGRRGTTLAVRFGVAASPATQLRAVG